MTKIRFRIIFVFLFVSSCCIYAQDWPFVETSLKYNDTTVIPFENQLYFKNQIDDNKCLSLIDFKKYHPMGAKKYVELFRVIEDVDSRPVCFEIGMIDRSHADIVLRYPNKQLAAGMCSENENITISVKTYKNIDLN